MKHPDQAALALHAGGDLGPLAAWRIRRHLANCGQCRAELAEFEAARSALPGLAEIPGLAWNRLAAEMKANIRVGLAAGECVAAGARPERVPAFFSGARAALAFASVIVLVATGVILQQRPAPPNEAGNTAGVEFQSTPNGVQVREGGSSLRLLHSGSEAKDVTYMPGAQGAMRASYVDSETNYVTVATVYAN